MKLAAVSFEFELDNPLIETDEGIVPARKCAVCIGVSEWNFRGAPSVASKTSGMAFLKTVDRFLM
eukprot:scaffold11430_cov165-Skeletonema_marinoi.AAC.3